MTIFVDDSDAQYFSLTNQPRPSRDRTLRHSFVVVDQAGYTWMRRQRGDHSTPRRFASEASAQAAIRKALFPRLWRRVSRWQVIDSCHVMLHLECGDEKRFLCRDRTKIPQRVVCRLCEHYRDSEAIRKARRQSATR